MTSLRFKPLLLSMLVSYSAFSLADPASNNIPDTAAPPSVAFQPATSQEVDLWSRIRRGYGIPNLENPLVNYQLNWYSTRGDYVLRCTERASRYLYHVVEELEKRGMPTELALLPFIESAFNPQAMSSAKASGMWQFIPSTGKDFNLKQNMFRDERRGVLDSTDAALNYLQKLYDMFGDWQLALAAYNWGEGSVQRAIKKQQAAGLPTDFDSMSYLMPKETQNYVPKLQAVKNIVSNPGYFNIDLPKVDNQPYFVSVEKTRDIDVRVAAQLAELTVAEFKELNPQFNRPVITGSTDTKILLPADNVEIYRNNLSKWEGPLSSWTAYTVAKNERIESIARRLGTQPGVLKDVNQVPGNMLVKAGSTLLIPRSSKADDTDISQLVVDHASLTMASDNTRKINVTASRSDSLNSIAKRYKVTTAQLKEWNSLKSDRLRSGQKLQIEVAAAPVRRNNSRVAVLTPVKKSIPKNKLVKKITVAQARLPKKPG
ncbi:membrane-bound lytic murein transglycosylase D [Oxalobacteraceae bacterium GrIS 1.18]